MNNQAKVYFNYLVSFSDESIKTGITTKPFYRLQDYIQEANRHSIKVDGFRITSPVESKRKALDLESWVCNENAWMAVDGHREWFKTDNSWMPDKFKKSRLIFSPSNDFYAMWLSIDSEWKLRNLASLCKFGFPNPYQKMIDFAEKLGTDGDRIKATMATEIARDLVDCQMSKNHLKMHQRREAAHD